MIDIVEHCFNKYMIMKYIAFWCTQILLLTMSNKLILFTSNLQYDWLLSSKIKLKIENLYILLDIP